MHEVDAPRIFNKNNFFKLLQMLENQVEHFWIMARIRACVHHYEEKQMKILKLFLTHYCPVYSILELQMAR